MHREQQVFFGSNFDPTENDATGVKRSQGESGGVGGLPGSRRAFERDMLVVEAFLCYAREQHLTVSKPGSRSCSALPCIEFVGLGVRGRRESRIRSTTAAGGMAAYVEVVA